MLEAALILVLFPARHVVTKYLLCTFACYAAAKLLERFDAQVFEFLGQAVSGHTLKHLVSASGVGWTIKYMKATA